MSFSLGHLTHNATNYVLSQSIHVNVCSIGLQALPPQDAPDSRGQIAVSDIAASFNASILTNYLAKTTIPSLQLPGPSQAISAFDPCEVITKHNQTRQREECGGQIRRIPAMLVSRTCARETFETTLRVLATIDPFHVFIPFRSRDVIIKSRQKI